MGDVPAVGRASGNRDGSGAIAGARDSATAPRQFEPSAETAT
ncbi:hypothetical protein [Natrononativus amylolyticus]|nr:hypothetical protein [Natrononativus amylolyticus]